MTRGSKIEPVITYSHILSWAYAFKMDAYISRQEDFWLKEKVHIPIDKWFDSQKPFLNINMPAIKNDRKYKYDLAWANED